MTLKVRVCLILRPDTEDRNEALNDARDFVTSCNEGWYAPVYLDGEPIVVEEHDDG